MKLKSLFWIKRNIRSIVNICKRVSCNENHWRLWIKHITCLRSTFSDGIQAASTRNFQLSIGSDFPPGFYHHVLPCWGGVTCSSFWCITLTFMGWLLEIPEDTMDLTGKYRCFPSTNTWIFPIPHRTTFPPPTEGRLCHRPLLPGNWTVAAAASCPGHFISRFGQLSYDIS